MAKHGSAERPGAIARLKEFYHEVIVELGKVSWPSWEEIKSSTQVVMFMLLLLAGIVFVLDIVFQNTVLLLLNTLA